MAKIFNILLVVISFILILMSVIALISIHLFLFQKPFSFTSAGFNFYLETLGQYKSLFAGNNFSCGGIFWIIKTECSY